MKNFTLALVVMFSFVVTVVADVVIRQDFSDGGKYVKVVPKKLGLEEVDQFWREQGVMRLDIVVPAIQFVDDEKKATRFFNSSGGFFSVRTHDDLWYLGCDKTGYLKLFLVSMKEKMDAISWKACGALCLSVAHYTCEKTGKKILVVDPLFCNGKIYGYQEADRPGY